MNARYLNYITIHGQEIGRRCAEGDKYAGSIVNIYRLYAKRPEHVAAALCEAAIDAYIKRYPQICSGCPAGWCLGCVPEDIQGD